MYKIHKLTSTFLILAFTCHCQIHFDTTGRAFSKIFNITLEKTSISEAKKIFGETEEYSDGDAASSSHRINYYMKNERAYVKFDAGEMGGGEIILAVKLSLVKPNEKYSVNPDSRLLPSELPGIRLGMSKEKFLKVFLKSKVKTNPDSLRNYIEDRKGVELLVHFENVIPMSEKEIQYYQSKDLMDTSHQKKPDLSNYYWTEMINLVPIFKKDKLIEITVSKVTSF